MRQNLIYISNILQNEEHKQRLHDLELQLEILRSENDSLHAENEQLKLRSKTDQDSMDKMMSSQGRLWGVKTDFFHPRKQISLCFGKK